MTDQPNDKAPRHRRATLELPDTVDLTSVGDAEMAVIRAAAQGLISSRVALDFTLMLEHRRRAIGDVELERRMIELQERQRELDEAGEP